MTRAAADPPVRERAVHRAFAILDTFGLEDEGLSLAELHVRTGIPKPTVLRIANELVGRRVLEKRDGEYRLGVRLFELGGLVAHQRSLRDVALPFLEDLYAATHDTVHLAVLDEGEVLYLEKLTGHLRVPTPSRVAGRLPPHCTAVGKALLAHTPALAAHVVERPLMPKTPHTIVDKRLFRRELDAVRRSGIAFEREELNLGVACAAAPIFATHGELVGAVSLSAPYPARDPSSYAPQVKVTARAITRALQPARELPSDD